MLDSCSLFPRFDSWKDKLLPIPRPPDLKLPRVYTLQLFDPLQMDHKAEGPRTVSKLFHMLFTNPILAYTGRLCGREG